MRKLSYLIVLIVILGLIISGCIFHVVPPSGKDESIDIVKNDVFCKIDLIAGQHTVAGFITVSNDDKNLLITYETEDSWLINETHLYVSTTIPTNSAPGKFPYKHEELGGITTDTYEITLEDLGVGPCNIVYIAAHAELVKGETEETGWAEGVEIRLDKNWAMYFEYRLSCDVVQEVLYMHDLAEEKLNDIVEGPGIDIENTLNILGEYLNEQTGVESTVIDYNLLQINYVSGLISFILLQEISTVPTLGGNIVRENTLSTPPYFRTTATNALEVRSDLNNSSMQITKDLDDVVYTGNRDVLIWAPLAAEHNIEGCNDTWSCDVVLEFVNSFKGSTLSFNITELENEEADVTALQNITDYGGMVIFYTHGEKKGKWLGTGEVVDTFWYLGGYNPYYEGWLRAKHMVIWQKIKVKGEGGVLVLKPVYAVNSSWFNSNLSGNFSNTIILNISCYSAKTDALWNVFKDKGAGAYFGLTDTTSGGFGITQGCNLIKKLSEGNLTTGEAYEKNTIDPFYPNTAWIMWGKENLKFPKDPVSSIEVLPETMTLIEGDSQSIDSIIAYYENGSTADVALDDCTYDSSNTGVTTVNNGVITAITTGTATITVSYTESGISKTDTVEVTVNAITPTPAMILSPVVGDLEIVSSIEQCSNTKWCFNQNKSGNHCQGEGICQADDTYAWDVNLNTPNHDSDNGMPVYAIEEGMISQTYGGCINAGGSYGQLLIEHTYQGNSWWSGYLHLKNIQVTTSQSVDQNTLLGYISNTSPKTIPNHLHFVVYKGQNSPSDLISFNTNIIPRDFPQTYYTITASAGPNGSISPSGNITVNEGSDKSFTITPDTGYQIDDILVDGSSLGAVSSYTFTNVTEDHTISATFSAAATGPVHNLTKGTYYDTIQAALDDAASDNIIEVSDGTYDESITFPYGKNLTLQSLNGASSTTILGNNGSPTVTLDGSLAGTTLEGFTITHTDGLTGRGIYIGSGYLNICNCTISGNFARSQWANAYGGGIQNGGTLTINESTISANYTHSPYGGVYGAYGGGINGGTLTMTGSNVCDNCASENGGGIYLGSTEIINIGGVSPSDKNTICGNYKTGEDPSLDQQIRGTSGSLYEIYRDTNYISAYCGVPSGPVHNLTKDTYYDTIQAALNDAGNDNIIEVSDGTYTENVDVNKEHLTIRSENGADSTIVQAANLNDDIFKVTTDYVEISGFTVKGIFYHSGIYLDHANYCTISNNTVQNYGGGIYLYYSSNNTLTNNTVHGILGNNVQAIVINHSFNNILINNTLFENSYGVDIYYSSNNTLINNCISNNDVRGIGLTFSSNNNIYLNDFINNNKNFYISDSTNIWHSPDKITYTYNGTTYTNYLGNYWYDYTGEDADNNGIGDTPYSIDGDQDSYPLMIPFENYY